MFRLAIVSFAFAAAAAAQSTLQINPGIGALQYL
jgi:hypothetical protein